MIQSGVYIITCLVNGKNLIGESSNIGKRLAYHKQNLRGNRHENPYLQAAFNKYGEDNFSFTYLEYCEAAQTKILENSWCKTLKTHNKIYGYNIRATEDVLKLPMSQETKDKIKNSQKTSEAYKNRDCGKGMRGKKHSKETIEKILKSREGFKHSKRTRERMSQANKGRILSQETKDKMLITRKNNGKVWHTEETKDKISLSNKSREYTITENRIKGIKSLQKKVLQIDKKTNMVIKEWEGASVAARTLGFQQGTISNCCRGEKHYKTYKGFIWKYKEN